MAILIIAIFIATLFFPKVTINRLVMDEDGNMMKTEIHDPMRIYSLHKKLKNACGDIIDRQFIVGGLASVSIEGFLYETTYSITGEQIIRTSHKLWNDNVTIECFVIYKDTFRNLQYEILKLIRENNKT